MTDPETTAFTGFGPAALDFYAALALDNSREYWLAHKAVYESDIKAPLQALVQELEPEFGEAKIFRPNRDIRFSADKRPYQEHASAGFSMAAGGGLYLHLSTDGLHVAGGCHEIGRDQLERFRDLQDDPRATKSLDAVLAEVAARGMPLGEGEPVKTAPRGRDREHPRIDLIRKTHLTVGRTFSPGPWLFDTRAFDRVVESFETAQLWNHWLADNVGPSTEAMQRR